MLKSQVNLKNPLSVLLDLKHLLYPVHEESDVIFVDSFVLRECVADRGLTFNYLFRQHLCCVHSSTV